MYVCTPFNCNYIWYLNYHKHYSDSFFNSDSKRFEIISPFIVIPQRNAFLSCVFLFIRCMLFFVLLFSRSVIYRRLARVSVHLNCVRIERWQTENVHVDVDLRAQSMARRTGSMESLFHFHSFRNILIRKGSFPPRYWHTIETSWLKRGERLRSIFASRMLLTSIYHFVILLTFQRWPTHNIQPRWIFHYNHYYLLLLLLLPLRFNTRK